MAAPWMAASWMAAVLLTLGKSKKIVILLSLGKSKKYYRFADFRQFTWMAF